MSVETYTQIELKNRAAELNATYAGASAEEVLTAVITREYQGRAGLVSSFGTEAAILLHMVSRIDPYAPVIFLETGKHFPQTLSYRDRLVETLGLCNLQVVTPRPMAVAAEDPDGFLHRSDPDLCCHVRKTIPMLQALGTLKCWISGRKRHQTADREGLDLFEHQGGRIKVNPLRAWTPQDVTAYFDRHALERHPLQAKGYPSIGCSVCTRPVAAGADPRSGRWADSDKFECGIHFENGKMVRG